MELMERILPVTVIIPCYNCVSTIEKTLQSVISQTFQPSEIILIDDCSTDGTSDLLKTSIGQYSNVKLVTLSINVGPGKARNVGWDMATQPWLAFLDADDVWHVDKLKIQWECILNNGHVVICGHETSLFKVNREAETFANISVKEVTFNKMLISNQFPTRSVMLKKDIPFRFLDKKVTEDYLLWLEIISFGCQALKINAVLAFSLRPDFSAGGYSGNLWKHEKRELRAFSVLKEKKAINSTKYVIFIIWSLIKYLRRLIISKVAFK